MEEGIHPVVSFVLHVTISSMTRNSILSLCSILIGLCGTAYGQTEVEAAQTSRVGDKVIWTTKALRMPEIDKHRDVCARTPGYMDGAICYKVCGGSLTSGPVKRELLWRVANQGSNTPFVPVNQDEGKIGTVEYYANNGRGCVTAMIWKGQQGAAKQRDLQIVQHLK